MDSYKAYVGIVLEITEDGWIKREITCNGDEKICRAWTRAFDVFIYMLENALRSILILINAPKKYTKEYENR